MLDLVGPSFPSALGRLNKTIHDCDPDKNWVHYHGAIEFDNLHSLYAQSDLGVFASSCENMPITLVEAMAVGLPIACSNRGPMPEVLADGGVYFDPENSGSIVAAIEQIMQSSALRQACSQRSKEIAKN